MFSFAIGGIEYSGSLTDNKEPQAHASVETPAPPGDLTHSEYILCFLGGLVTILEVGVSMYKVSSSYREILFFGRLDTFWQLSCSSGLRTAVVFANLV